MKKLNRDVQGYNKMSEVTKKTGRSEFMRLLHLTSDLTKNSLPGWKKRRKREQEDFSEVVIVR